MRHQIDLVFGEDNYGQPQAQLEIRRCDEKGQPVDFYFSGKIVRHDVALCQERALSIIRDEVQNYENNFA